MVDIAPQIWLILGAGSPVGRAWANKVASTGHQVILAGRDTNELQLLAADIHIRHSATVHVLAFDALATASHAHVVETAHGYAVAADLPLSLFVAFAAMPEQTACDGDFAVSAQMIATNFTGAVSILQRATPLFEKQQAGTIVIIGSVAGDRGRPKNYLYGATKAALHTYASGLRARLAKSQVQVLSVRPGFIDTQMTWGLGKLPFMATPAGLANGIWQSVKNGADEVYLPRIWTLIMLIIRNIPEVIFKKLKL